MQFSKFIRKLFNITGDAAKAEPAAANSNGSPAIDDPLPDGSIYAGVSLELPLHQDRASFLAELDAAAEAFRKAPLKERFTVVNPNGGLRTEVREIRFAFPVTGETTMQQVEIEYQKDSSVFKVVLHAVSLDVFIAAAQQPNIRDKEGEELVAALLAHAKGAISGVFRYKDDKQNDGPNGEPATQKFNDSGMLIVVARYKDDKFNDGPNGEAAFQKFNGSGALIRVTRYKDGELIEVLSKQGIAAYRDPARTADDIANIHTAFGKKLKVRGM